MNLGTWCTVMCRHSACCHSPKCMSCHKAIVMIIGRVYCFHDYIYITVISLLWDLSTLCIQSRLVYVKKASPLTNYLPTVTFCCYLLVLGNFIRFFHNYFFYWGFLLISRSTFQLCTIFEDKLKWIDNNDNDDKYSNNRHISIEIIYSEKTEKTWDEYRL